MKNYCHVWAISNGTVVSYLEPVKRERRSLRLPGPRSVDREISGLAEELDLLWDLRWRTIFCKDLPEVQKAVAQAFHAHATAEELEKKGIDLHIRQEAGVAYAPASFA